MIYNRIPVSFGELRAITAPAINYQFDVVQMLVINDLDLPDYYEVDFCNPGDSQTITIVGTADGVRIPDNLLLTGKDVIAYIVIQGIDEGAVETRYEVKIPVRDRPARSDIQPTPSERLEIDELVNALNDGVERAEDAAEAAEGQADRAETAADNAESAVEHYPKIENGYWYVWINGGWVNTGIKAEGTDGKGIASVTGQKTSTSGLVDTYTLTVTYTDSTTDTITFTVTNGTDGTDGVSPEVSIETITGGHRVTITDKDHPTGQSFDVLDGEITQADLDAALATKAPVIIDTASGSIASFHDGADDMPVKSLVVNVEPQQDLHGQDVPYPAGGGKNKLPLTICTGVVYNQSEHQMEAITRTENSWTQGSNSITYVTTSTYTPCGLCTELLPAGTYTITAKKLSAGTVRYTSYSVSESLLATKIQARSALSDETNVVTLSASGYIFIYLDNGSTASQTLEIQIQVEEGSTATAYTPYENLCPITGFTGLSIEQRNTNLAPTTVPSNIIAGTFTTSATSIRSASNARVFAFPVPKGCDICVQKLSGSTSSHSICLGDTGNIAVGTPIYNPLGFTNADMQNINTGTHSWLYVQSGNMNNVDSLFATDEFMVSIGTGRKPYVAPHNGTTYPISWQTEAGTVYGCNINPITGVLAVDWFITTVGDLSWSYYSGAVYTTINGKIADTQGVKSFIISDQYKTINPVANMGSVGSWDDMSILGNYSNSSVVYIKDTRYTTAADFKTANATSQICYKLAQPITVQLDPITISTLLGENNIWHDANGDVSVEYCADTKLYLEKLTQPTEDDMIANSAIASGKYFFVGNRLFLSTATIANGATLTPGTNCVETNLAEALNALNF